MPPSSFSPLTPRWCASCQEPLQGRSDKKYCSDACRSMGNRHGLGEEAAVDWPAQVEAAEQTVRALQAQLDAQAQAWQAAFAFEQGYDNLTLLLNMVLLEVEELSPFTRFVEVIDQLLAYYQQHPGLVMGEVHAQRRLAHLQQVRATIIARQAALQRKEAQRLREAATEAARVTAEAARAQGGASAVN
jgi:hypothetical protein